MSNSKNSFRIDDILSSDTSCPTLLQPTAAKKRAFGSLDNSSSFDMPKQKPPATFHHAEQQKELQNALFTLLSQQFNNLEPSAMSQVLLNIFKSTQPQPQPQLIHPTPISANIHESYFNEYYARLMNHNSPEDYLPPPSAKRFKPTLLPSNTNNNRDQFQALFLSKFLSQQPVQSRDSNYPSLTQSDKLTKRLSSEDAYLAHNHHQPSAKAGSFSSSATSSSSTSSSSTPHDVLNTSPRSLLSNSSESDSTSSSTTNSASESTVSPLDALLHLANSTFTANNSSHFHGHRPGSGDIEPPLLANIYKLKKSLYASDENGLLGCSELLHESDRTSHNTSFDSSINGGNSNPITANNNNYHSQSKVPLSNHHLSHNISHHHHHLLNNSSGSLSSSTATPSGPTNTKRKRKNRTAFTANQIFELEKRFSNQRYLSPHDRDRIAYELSLSTSQVITWFQNRRAKQKRDIEELKNDVTAAKSLKAIDSDVDVSNLFGSNGNKDGSRAEDENDSDQDYGSNNEYCDSDDEQENNVSTSSSSNELNK